MPKKKKEPNEIKESVEIQESSVYLIDPIHFVDNVACFSTVEAALEDSELSDGDVIIVGRAYRVQPTLVPVKQEDI